MESLYDRPRKKSRKNFMLFFERGEWNIAQNFKVFSSLVAERVSGKNVTTRQQFTLPSLTSPNKKVALLVADPIKKFYAACREDKIAPELALEILKANSKLAPFPSFPSFHFFPQCRYLLNHDEPVYAWRAPDHIGEFWEKMSLGEPPNIYNRSEEYPVEESELRKIYKQDFDLWEQITSPEKLVVPSTTLKEELHYFCSSSSTIEETLDNVIVQSGKSTRGFARPDLSTTNPEILATREATCRACPQWDAEALNRMGRCRECGCSTWTKLRKATERCPLGKWEAVD